MYSPVEWKHNISHDLGDLPVAICEHIGCDVYHMCRVQKKKYLFKPIGLNLFLKKYIYIFFTYFHNKRCHRSSNVITEDSRDIVQIIIH